MKESEDTPLLRIGLVVTVPACLLIGVDGGAKVFGWIMVSHFIGGILGFALYKLRDHQKSNQLDHFNDPPQPVENTFRLAA